MIIIYIFFIGFLCWSIYIKHKLKEEYLLVDAVCIDYSKHSHSTGRHYTHTYKGLYKYKANGREYVVLDEKSRKMRRPKIDQPTKIYIRKDSFETFIPKDTVRFWNTCTVVLGLMSLLDIATEIIRAIMI